MLLCFMGASCTGKSTAADEMIKTLNGKVYSGKDYLKLAKNKEDAEKAFKSILEESNDNIIYVVSEIEDLVLVPEKTFKVLFITELDIMKERFAKRMNGNLPAPVAAPVAVMLERKATAWKDQSCDLLIESNVHSVQKICDMIQDKIIAI